ncbi:hypothetical protein CU097_002723 [Rhizopus azygosporus]|uniref:Uncharacterized protein n=1 Tax=Rhizopus azygosporus TaxID=86630 RepID=A0A367ISR5_RHIAZ|nr:hypothetical protein CU097_002723 [Rhizopus azygosporus]
MLHSGAIIIDEETVFTIAAEAYCRSTAIDIHGETNLKTLVLPSIPIPLAFYTAKDAWRIPHIIASITSGEEDILLFEVLIVNIDYLTVLLFDNCRNFLCKKII